jgi:histidinol-phosphate aminotransferase
MIEHTERQYTCAVPISISPAAAMLPFLRPDLAQLNAYTPHPEAVGEPNLIPDRLDTNECPYDLPIELKQKLAWTYQHEIEANRYPDGGHDALKTAIALYVTESDPNSSDPNSAVITPTQISVGNGSDELLRSLLIATCLGGQGSILVANPTFSMYGILAQTLGIPVVSMGRTPEFAVDLEEATEAVDPFAPNPVRVVFMVHPNSPTGNALTAAEIEWLRQLPPNILVVIDEAYFEFSQQTLVSELAHRPNWVILRTFSKAFRLAAHRVGYAIAHPTLIQVLEKVRLPYNLPAMSQAAAHLALTHRAQLLESIPELFGERDRMAATLSQIPRLQLWPSAANFIYARLETEAETVNLQQTLKKLGTSIRYTGGGLRITIGTPAENDRTLLRMKELLP